MQTFLPFPSFELSAASLDRQRLGKQRVEAWQILRALRGESRGWTNHPAVRMWLGCEAALVRYGIAVCREWIARGYRDTLLERFVAAGKTLTPDRWDGPDPAWLGDPAFHHSHQSNLVRKDPVFYGPKFLVPSDLPYVWPC